MYESNDMSAITPEQAYGVDCLETEARTPELMIMPDRLIPKAVANLGCLVQVAVNLCFSQSYGQILALRRLGIAIRPALTLNDEDTLIICSERPGELVRINLNGRFEVRVLGGVQIDPFNGGEITFSRVEIFDYQRDMATLWVLNLENDLDAAIEQAEWEMGEAYCDFEDQLADAIDKLMYARCFVGRN